MNPSELLSVNLDILRDRLVRLGWRQDDEDRSLLFTPDDQTAFIPFGEPDNSKVLALEAIFNYLGDGHRSLDAETILSQTTSSHDVVFLGIEISRRPGRLPLGMSGEFYDRWEGFFGQAAAAEVNYNPRGTRRLPNDATYLVQQAEWGQTAKGSFLHALHIPLAPNLMPLGRRTWHRMLRCIETLGPAAAEGTADALLDLGSQGWTAPMCETISDLVDATQATTVKALAVPDIAFSDLLPEANVEVEATYDPESLIMVLSHASLALRGLLETKEVTVNGNIYQLTDPSIVGDDKPRTIRILWRQEGGGDIRINVELGPKDYEIAEKSYLERRPVSIRGVLGNRGTAYWLREPNGLQLT